MALEDCLARREQDVNWGRVALTLIALIVALVVGWAMVYAFGKFLLEAWS